MQRLTWDQYLLILVVAGPWVVATILSAIYG